MPEVAALQSVRGAGLVEVMIAQLALAIGLLGLLAMHLLALQAGFDATQLTRASALGSDVLTRIRQNPGQLEHYLVSDLGGTTPSAAPDCQSLSCTPQQMVTYDLARWQRYLSSEDSPGGGLLEGRLCIELFEEALSLVVAWRGLSPGGSAPPGRGQAASCGVGEGLYGEGDSERRWLQLLTFVEGG